MGTWGPGPFQNDGISDLLGELEYGEKPSKITQQIRRYLKAPERYNESLEMFGWGELVYASVSGDVSRIPEEMQEKASKFGFTLQDAKSALMGVEKALEEADLSLWRGDSGRKFFSGLRNLESRLHDFIDKAEKRKTNPLPASSPVNTFNLLVRPWRP